MDLKTYLEENGLTQAQFADLAKISQAAVSKIVNADMWPRPAIIARIEKATKGKVRASDIIALHAAE